MSLSIFAEKATVPNEDLLTEALSDGIALWDAVKAHVETVCGTISVEWKFYSKKAGWSFVVKNGKRTVLYMIPRDAFFSVNFVFGEKAVATAIMSDLPGDVKTALSESRQYIEGTTLMLDVRTAIDVDNIKKLIEIKHSH